MKENLFKNSAITFLKKKHINYVTFIFRKKDTFFFVWPCEITLMLIAVMSNLWVQSIYKHIQYVLCTY